jgi:steroid delta-isomerase-like uncharacterized protein
MKRYTAKVNAQIDAHSPDPAINIQGARLSAAADEGDDHRTIGRPEVEEEQKDLVRRVYNEIINQGNMALASEVIAADFVDHVPHVLPGQPTAGPEALTWLVSLLRTVFPDLHAEIDRLVIEGDRVVVRAVWSGTHQGQFVGFTPTGKHVQVMVIEIARIANGKIVEHWGEMDVLGMLEQLGLMPGPIGTMG